MLTRRDCILGASAAALAPVITGSAGAASSESNQDFDPYSRTALASFRHSGNSDELHDKFDAENVTVSVAQHHIRVSPSVFNDMNDIDRLLEALS